MIGAKAKIYGKNTLSTGYVCIYEQGRDQRATKENFF